MRLLFSLDKTSPQDCISHPLQQEQLPTAFLCAGDFFAIDVMGCARAKGLNVPEDISLMSLDDLLVFRYLDPPLSPMTFNKELLGEKSMQLLYQIIQGEPHEKINLIKTTPAKRASIKRIWRKAAGSSCYFCIDKDFLIVL